ncbi:MAG: hypothetical protein K0S75_848 [Clostridia bacterium]|nr:hypothetical protein [Clostridia bacterium]
MPNRIIKESICISEDIDELSPEEEAFFYRIIVNCDDYGRMDARTQIVRAKCYPLRTDRLSLEVIDSWLLALTKRLITLYEVCGKRYLQVNTWERHQNIRAKESKFPSIEEGDIINLHMNTDEYICNHVQSNVPVSRISYLDTRNSILDNMSAPVGTDDCAKASAEKPNSKGGAQNGDSGKGKNEYTDEFEKFWSYYPRKTEKSAAFSKWKARLKQKVSAADMIKAAQNYAEKCKLEGAEERFIKHAKTFLGENKPFEEFITGTSIQKAGKAYPLAGKSKSNGFNNFTPRDYDHKDLEEKLLKRSSIENPMSEEEFEKLMADRRARAELNVQ